MFLSFDDVLYVPSSTKNFLSMLAMPDLRCMAELVINKLLSKTTTRTVVIFLPKVCEKVAFTSCLLIRSNMEL
jgi:hypothetical protein